jgi:hypothetical protein
MDTTNILGLAGFGVSMVGVVYTALNHKRVRSKCCGRVIEASLDVEDTTPVDKVKVGALKG